MRPDLYTANVLLVTLDSCSYSTALNAKTPNLDSLAELKRAETHATYTLPAHWAFFTGNLPRIMEEDTTYLPEIQQVWRSGSAREKDTSGVGLVFEEQTILEYYFRKGYDVLGIGGVSFFNPASPNAILPKLFPRFKYFGPVQQMSRKERIPRDTNWFPLAHSDEIVSSVQEPYFLMINSPATHIPYDTPGTDITPLYREEILRIYREHDKQKKLSDSELEALAGASKLAFDAQVRALQWADQQLGYLIKSLPSKGQLIVIVCGDHGEEFGEERRFGHYHPSKSVLEVPVWSGVKNG